MLLMLFLESPVRFSGKNITNNGYFKVILLNFVKIFCNIFFNLWPKDATTVQKLRTIIKLYDLIKKVHKTISKCIVNFS